MSQVAPNAHRDGWTFIASLAAQWAERPEHDDVSRFLAGSDPFPTGLPIYHGRDRVNAVVTDRLGLSTWLICLEDSKEIEIDPASIVPRTPPTIEPASFDLVPPAPTRVCVDSAEENMIPEMALSAHAVLEESWNGWSRPLATALQVEDFLRRWRRNDSNGTWGLAVEIDGSLLVTRPDGEEPDYFAQRGRRADGSALYDLTGWAWVVLSA